MVAWLIWVGVLGLVAVAAAYLLRKHLRGSIRQIEVDAALRSFRWGHEQLEAKFCDLFGRENPHRLRDLGEGQRITFHGPPKFVRDRKSRRIIALVPITVDLAIARDLSSLGDDLDRAEFENVTRMATAVFTYIRGRWSTSGRALFNLTPGEAAERMWMDFELLTPSDSEGSHLA